MLLVPCGYIGPHALALLLKEKQQSGRKVHDQFTDVNLVLTTLISGISDFEPLLSRLPVTQNSGLRFCPKVLRNYTRPYPKYSGEIVDSIRIQGLHEPRRPMRRQHVSMHEPKQWFANLLPRDQTHLLCLKGKLHVEPIS